MTEELQVDEDQQVDQVDYFQRLHEALRLCDPFDSDEALMATFGSDPRLHPWEDLVPDAYNRAERIQAVVALLKDRRNAAGESGLLLLLHVLRDRVDPADALHRQLDDLASEYKRLATPRDAGVHDALTARDADHPAEPVPGRSPYKGLYYYEVDDAGRFFGREALTAALLRLLPDPGGRGDEEVGKTEQFVAVVGPSGSGKTSLLRAGLIPALGEHDEAPPASGRWPRRLLTPTARPLHALAASLTRDDNSVRATAELADALREDDRSLGLYARKLLAREEEQPAGRLLLLVDQFEETFILCEDVAARRAFVDNLVTACSEGPAIVVVALRSEFYDAAGPYERLRKLLAQRQVYIGRMADDDLRRAIVEPAVRAGWQLEPGLVDLILQDVGQEQGALPPLSQALHETWRRRSGRTLTRAGYRHAGGVSGAIAQTAETTYTGLPAEQQSLARAILLRLVVPAAGDGEKGLLPDVRAQASREELLGGNAAQEQQAAVDAVLSALARAHLIRVEGNEITAAHEALIREWPRFREWLQTERGRLRLHRRLTTAARQWRELGNDSDLTYRGSQLVRAEAYATDPAIPLSKVEAEFLSASARVAREAEEARRRQLLRLQRAAVAGLGAGAAASAGAFFLAYAPMIDDRRLLLLLTFFEALLGAIAGALLVGLVEMALIAHSGRERSNRPAWLRWPLAAAAGAPSLALLLFLHAFLTGNPLLPAALQGALWGAAAGAGRVLLQRREVALWLRLFLIAVAGSLLLLLVDSLLEIRSAGAFAFEEQGERERARPAAIAVAGALVPLAVLAAAHWAAWRRPAPETGRESRAPG